MSKDNVMVCYGSGRPKTPRDYARECAEEAIALLAHAFNACDNPALPYRYSQNVLDRFENAGREIVGLIEGGVIKNLPHVAAKNDATFQQFMKRARETPGKRCRTRIASKRQSKFSRA